MLKRRTKVVLGDAPKVHKMSDHGSENDSHYGQPSVAHKKRPSTLLQVGLSKEQIERDYERDENIAKMMTQIDLLSKHVMEDGTTSVNAVGTNNRQCPDDV
uniref:Integrase core domain containing protein n=1 Tax=Solanum tuberosum TaxID=4113 RepID=M1DU25_SOLTU